MKKNVDSLNFCLHEIKIRPCLHFSCSNCRGVLCHLSCSLHWQAPCRLPAFPLSVCECPSSRSSFVRSVCFILLLSLGKQSNHLVLVHSLLKRMCPSSSNHCKNSELICWNRRGERNGNGKFDGEKVLCIFSVCVSPWRKASTNQKQHNTCSLRPGKSSKCWNEHY